MVIGRVTTRMLTASSISAVQSNLAEMAKTQEQMATGKLLNRPSDNPTDTTAAMRLRWVICSKLVRTRTRRMVSVPPRFIQRRVMPIRRRQKACWPLAPIPTRVFLPVKLH